MIKNIMSASHLVLVSWIVSVLGGASQMELTNRSSEYFITTPSTATVMLGLSLPNRNSTHPYIGQFQCVTRVGFKLVWVINGISADNIRGTPGFEQVTYELIPVQDSGNTLSILNIPATTQVNGTIVTCTAVYNQSIEAHSQPVYLIVTAEADSTEAATPSTMTVVTTTNGHHDNMEVPAYHDDASPQMMKGLVVGIGVFAAIILALVVLAAIVIVGVIIVSRRGRHKRLQARGGPRESNIYWSATNSQALPQNNYEKDNENFSVMKENV